MLEQIILAVEMSALSDSGAMQKVLCCGENVVKP